MSKLFDIKDLKKQLSAKTVAGKYLGMPKEIIGKNYYYDTPFREGVVSENPLVVSDNYIVDRGGDFKGDIITFVKEFKGVSYLEAIKIIAKDFNIQGLAEGVTEKELNVVTEKVKHTDIVLETGEKTDNIITMLDTVGYRMKPSKKDAGEIKNRIPSLQMVPYNLDTLCQMITKGHTCIPAGIAGEAMKNWNQQQVFMVDIDNTEKVGRKNQKILSDEPAHVSIEKAMKYCKEIGLLPTFIYKSFSYTEECNKFRLVYVMEKPVTDMIMAEGIYCYLVKNLKPLNIDVAPTQLESMFFGGTELCENTGIYYKPVKKDIEEEKTRYEIIMNYGDEYKTYLERAEAKGYGVKSGYLCKVDIHIDKTGATNEKFTPLSNFLPVITKQVTYCNGKDSITNYNVKGLLLDNKKELPEITVTGEELENAKYFTNPEWNIQAVKEPNIGVDEHIRYVAQVVSKDSLICKNVYAHTGFIRINEKLVYLSQGQVIGDVKNLDVDLSLDRLEQYHFTENEFDVKEALKTSYSILDVAEHKITIPLLAVTYLAPLTTLFAENGLLADFVVWLEGKTGSRKSSLAAVLLSHNGNFTRNNFPCSFRDTANSLEKKAYVLKDTLNVIDDFNPETVGTGKTGTSEKLLGMYGDRAGRDRMSRDGKSLNGAYFPRGLCIMTGESFPKVAESRLARAILVDIKPTSIDLSKLKNVQDNIEKLSFSMKKFIERIIVNEETIIEKAIRKQNEMREKEIQGKLHGRTLEAVTMLTIGFELFLEFICENDVITVKEKESLSRECDLIMEELAEQQKDEIDSNKPTELFVTGIKQLCETGKAQIMDYEIPCDPKLCPNLIGYYCNSEGHYYLLPETAYAEVIKFYRSQGIRFPVSKTSLQKMLADEGFLYITEKNDRKTVKRKLPNTKVTEAVWAIYQDKLGLRPFSEEVAELEEAQNEFRKQITK